MSSSGESVARSAAGLLVTLLQCIQMVNLNKYLLKNGSLILLKELDQIHCLIIKQKDAARWARDQQKTTTTTFWSIK